MDRHDLAEGTVDRWSDVEGWGVLRSDHVEGLVFAHFAVIRDQAGHRSLTPGQQVWFRWELPGQDGCDVSARDIWIAGPPATPPADALPENRPGAAYRSDLTITVADPPDGSPPPSP